MRKQETIIISSMVFILLIIFIIKKYQAEILSREMKISKSAAWVLVLR